MSSITGTLAGLSVSLIAAIPVAHAEAVTPSAEEIMFRYEGRAAGPTGGLSPIAAGQVSVPTSFAAAADTDSRARSFKVSALGQQAAPSSFAERMALNFSLGEHAGRDAGFESLLLAGLGLFGLIARQRIVALTRSPIYA